MAEIAAIEPRSITQGDTLKFSKHLSSYPASAGWALSYTFLGPTKQTIATTVSGDSFLFSAATTAWTAGSYAYQGTVSNGTESYVVVSGRLEVKASLTAGVAGADTRSQIKRILDALIAAFEGRATRTDLSYTISTGGVSRSIQNMTHAELITSIKQYRQWYADEIAAERISNGLGTGRKVVTRFK